MKDIEEVRKRMNQRKSNKYKNKLTDFHFSKFYNLMIKCMVVLLVVMAVVTYLKVTPNGQYISEHVFSKIHYDELMTWINTQFYQFFPSEVSSIVSSEISYTHIEDNLYTNHSNEVVNFSKGRVIYLGEGELLGKYITVLLDNNVEVTFGKLTDVFVSQFDTVEEATILGTCEDNVMIIFTQGEKEIDYETFESIIKDN